MAIDTLSLDFGSDKTFYVYLYRDPRPKKKRQPIYVGKGKVNWRRADQHWRYGTHNPILKAMFAKFRSAGLEPIIEIIAWFDDEPAAFALESALIVKFGRKDTGAGSLANLTDGGEGISGHRHTEAARKAIADAGRGKPMTEAIRAALHNPESRRKAALARLGRPMPESTKAKIRAAQIGIPKPPERIARVAAALRGRRQSEEANAKRRVTSKAIAKRAVPLEVEAQIAAAYVSGNRSMREIGNDFGVSKRVVGRIVKDLSPVSVRRPPKRPMLKLTDEMLAAAGALRAEGWTFKALAVNFGVTDMAIHGALKKRGLIEPRQSAEWIARKSLAMKAAHAQRRLIP